MIRRLFSLFVFCLVVHTGTYAQDSIPVPLVSLSFSGGVSGFQMTDPYLSELTYSGLGLHGNYTLRKPLRPYNGRYSKRLDIQGILAGCTNPPGTATMMYLAEQLGYGIQRHCRLNNRAELLVGGELGTLLGIKSYGREVNNPLNLDMSAELELAVTFRYRFTGHARNLCMIADLRSPLAGIMFVPERGESYYEILDLMQTDNTLHFSSLHNRNGLDLNLMFRYPLRYNVLEFGFQKRVLRYSANDMYFKTGFFAFKLGLTYDLALFGGKRNPVRTPFVSAQ